jgi:hypothetical protein
MEPGHGSKAGRLREAAIAALLSEPTIAAAAVKVGVGEATLQRWMQDADFARDFARARQALLAEAVAALVKGCTAAVGVLVDGLKAERPADRLRAADLLLANTLKATNLLDLANRLSAIEDDVEQDRRRRLGPHLEDPADE